MISYLLPTCNRPECLRRTLDTLGRLDPRAHTRFGGAEVIVIDNASSPPARAPKRLANGWPLILIRRKENNSSAARNEGARRARGEWLIMLDDDSQPLDDGHLAVLADTPPEVSAIGAEIFLPDGSREAGGLPEVFVGCGVAIRTEVFLEAGGYDETFGFYVEEYDLCARLLMAGGRVEHDRRFRVLHHKQATGRDMNVILHRLVRNNGWVMQRYAPRALRDEIIERLVARYGRIAAKEDAMRGYQAGVDELGRTRAAQPRRTMTPALFDRFTGLTQARETILRSAHIDSESTVAIVEPGKNLAQIRLALESTGARMTGDVASADVLVVGTLSPGPMLDAAEAWSDADQPVVTPWRWHSSPALAHAG